MGQWDNGVSGLKVRVFTDTPSIYHQSCFFFFVCMHLSVHSLLLHAHSCVPPFSLTQNKWMNRTLSSGFSDAIAYPQIKSWRVAGFRAAVTLLATAWCQGPELLSGHGTMPRRAICLSIKNNQNTRPDNLSNFLLSKHIMLADLQCSLSPPAALSAGKSLFLSHTHTHTCTHTHPPADILPHAS